MREGEAWDAAGAYEKPCGELMERIIRELS
jgi:hypothetical protein